VILFGVLNKEKALQRFKYRLKDFKSPSLLGEGDLGDEVDVDKRFEISNLDLIRDIVEIIKIDE
jgi:hypothetical protein